MKYRYYITDGYIFISNDTFFHWNHGLKLNFFVFFVVEKNCQNGQKWPKNGQKWEISVRKGFMWPRNAFLRKKCLPKLAKNGGGSKMGKNDKF